MPQRSFPRQWLAWLALLPLIFLVYFPVLDGPFLLDDQSSIVRNSDIRALTPYNLLAMVKSHRDVRAVDRHPVSAFSFLLDYLWAGLDPFSFHISNLLYLWLAAGAALWLAATAGMSFWPAALLAAAWVLHPLASMQAGYLTGRQETIFILLSLLSLGCLLRNWRILCILAAALALLTKEVAVSLPVIILLADWAWHKDPHPLATLRRNLRFYGALTIIWLLLCAYHLFGGRRHEIGAAGMPLGRPLDYFLSQTQVWLSYLRVFFFPAKLEFYPYIRPVQTWMAALPGLAMAIVYLAIALWLAPRQRKAAALLLIPVCILSVTSSFIPIPYEPAMEYRMFFPAFFLLAFLMQLWWRSVPLAWLRFALPLLLIAALGVRSHLRAKDYSSAIQLFEVDLRHDPRNLNALDGLAESYRLAQFTDRATASAWRLVDLALEENNREYAARGFVYLGLLESERKNFAEAKDFLGRAIALNGNWNARLNLARIHVELYELSEAEKLLQLVLERSPDNPTALTLLYEARMSARKPAEAEPILERLLHLYPERQDLQAQRARIERMKRER